MRTARVLFFSLALFILLDHLLFQRTLYGRYLNPDSTTGHLELVLNNEIQREKKDGNQILTIGDSRMGFFPRYANALHSELGYTFGTVASAGTTPRCWYYLLRAADPTHRQYRAIVIALDDFDDNGRAEDFSQREIDVKFVAPRLGWLDIADFAGSYPQWGQRARAAFAIAFHGFAYNRDFQDFLLNPAQRIEQAGVMREGSWHWFADYRGPDTDVAGFTIDWKRRSFTAPPGLAPALAERFRDELFGRIYPAPPPRTAYLRRWLGAIVDAYQGSPTKIIFIKLPRGPYPRPDFPPRNPDSSVRGLARDPNVILDSEGAFEALEDPKLFLDPMHFNGPGEEAFSVMLGRRVRALTGPPL